jgi:small subunit ribosomal protein S20
MPVIQSVKKSLRAADRRRAFNQNRKDALRESTKNIKKAIAAGKKTEAAKLLSAAYKALDKGAKRGIIKKNTASRKKSRLSKAIKKLS